LAELLNSGGTRAAWVNAIAENISTGPTLPAVGAYPMFDSSAGGSCGRPMVFSGFLGAERAFSRNA